MCLKTETFLFCLEFVGDGPRLKMKCMRNKRLKVIFSDGKTIYVSLDPFLSF